jgi:hypothetical protein
MISKNIIMMADWSSGLKSRLRNQSSRVQISVVSRDFCDEQFTLAHESYGCLCIIINITYIMHIIRVCLLSII